MPNKNTKDITQGGPLPTPISVPDGFVLAADIAGTPCIVPAFMLPATNQAFDCYQKKIDSDALKQSGGVSCFIRYLFMPGRSLSFPFSSIPMPVPCAGVSAGAGAYVYVPIHCSHTSFYSPN
jgi:hypothetical protein